MPLFQNPSNPANSLFQPGQQTGLFSNPAGQSAGLFPQGTVPGSSLFGTNPSQPAPLAGGQASGGLFGAQPVGGAPGSTLGVGSNQFGGTATNTTPNSGLFGANPGGSLFGSQGPSNSGGLFGTGTAAGQGTGQPGPLTGSLFGATGSAPSTGNPSGGLFGANPSGGSFGPQRTSSTGGLFGSGTSGATGNQTAGTSTLTGNTTGGLFGTNNSTGGLFGTQSAQTSGGLFGSGAAGASGPPSGNPSGGLFGGANPSSGLFASNTGQGAGLFGQPTNPSSGSSLFGGTAGGLFGQSSMFSTPATPTFGGQTSGALYGNLMPGGSNITFVPYQNYSDKIIENLTQSEKDNLFSLKNQIENNDSNLIQAENTLNKISQFKNDIKNRFQELFTFARKVQTAEKRCKASLEIVKKFQGNISLFIKDAVKVFDRCERADGFNQIDSPGVFLSDMLTNCEERLKSIEESFKEIQELVLIEERSNEFVLLVKTIAMMQTKFELVSSLTFDMHKRVLEVTNRYSMTFGIDLEETCSKDLKIKEVSKSLKTSSLADLIAARPGSTSYRFL